MMKKTVCSQWMHGVPICNKEVKYLDKRAETDPYAQEEITLFLAGLDTNISDKEV